MARMFYKLNFTVMLILMVVLMQEKVNFLKYFELILADAMSTKCASVLINGVLCRVFQLLLLWNRS